MIFFHNRLTELIVLDIISSPVSVHAGDSIIVAADGSLLLCLIGLSLPDSWGKRSVHLTSFIFSLLHAYIKFVGQNAIWLPFVFGGLYSHTLVSSSLGHAESIWETSDGG